MTKIDGPPTHSLRSRGSRNDDVLRIRPKRPDFWTYPRKRPRRGRVFRHAGFRCGAIPLIAPHWTGPFKTSRQRLCGRRFNRTGRLYDIVLLAHDSVEE